MSRGVEGGLQATAREYAELGVRRSIAAPVPGFVIAQAAITLGIPVSFNDIIISGIIGGGLPRPVEAIVCLLARLRQARVVEFEYATLAHRAVGRGHDVQHRHRAVERLQRVDQRVLGER